MSVKRKQTLGRKRTKSTPGPKVHASGSAYFKITMSVEAWQIVATWPGKTLSRQIEGGVRRLDAIDTRNGIGGGM